MATPTIDDDDHWEVIANGTAAASYLPTTDDVGKYLRVVAMYDDSTVDAPGNANTVRMVTRYKVREALENNGSPDFPAGDHTRSVAETASVGTAVGMPVTATEHDAEDRGKLIYGLIANTTNTDDDDYFKHRPVHGGRSRWRRRWMPMATRAGAATQMTESTLWWSRWLILPLSYPPIRLLSSSTRTGSR